MKEIMMVIGAGAIGQAIARRVSQGKTVLLADLNSRNCAAAAQTLRDAGFTVETSQVDVSSRQSIQHLVQQATALADLIMGPEGGYISGSDFLMDGGVTASYWYGDLKP
ncbi:MULTISPECIES: SDR family NAD(P)-dependent oxidoreductase [Pantoea]|uniref:SDR family NAD(P)-dependent oxidoreductase n=1 Tax=Candidatus Pantoea communis TaxID=2608354 RepID=A0ABX0RVL2_9GAMM|nr:MULTISPECIES: SDR family NAD(P)-dependent oxidoreductase [Pantoea]NIG19645.1 SDR family NAD(P)-dependent oxidoreductase [Pantoea communis]